ncbi:MAG: inositol monophosphatase [Deltaproteobacteria bacterium]|nr:inositol monophosphatase [Deltaproteobacteria bacterium]
MWDKELRVAGQAARAAGNVFNRTFGRVHKIMKKGDIDLVTEADLEAEKTILEIIRRNFPRDNVLTEETGLHGDISDRIWIVDPLDGTTNFAHGFPFFAVSIALEIKKEIMLGIVYNPYMEEYFQAAKGTGAYLNNKPIKVSKIQTLDESLLGTGFPYDIHEKPETVMDLFTKMLVRAQGVRRPGSAAIDMCYVAAGRFDGFWESDLKPWDTAAGTIIVKEAGGKLSTYEGNPYDPYKKSIVAANPFIHDAMMQVLMDNR